MSTTNGTGTGEPADNKNEVAYFKQPRFLYKTIYNFYFTNLIVCNNSPFSAVTLTA